MEVEKRSGPPEEFKPIVTTIAVEILSAEHRTIQLRNEVRSEVLALCRHMTERVRQLRIDCEAGFTSELPVNEAIGALKFQALGIQKRLRMMSDEERLIKKLRELAAKGL